MNNSLNPAEGGYVPSDAEIAIVAHRFYEQEGRPDGKAEEHWARAKQELQQLRSTQPALESSPNLDLEREAERDTQASGKMG